MQELERIILCCSEAQTQEYQIFVDELKSQKDCVFLDDVDPNDFRDSDCHIVLGGDGSLNYLLNQTNRENSKVIYFPTGTANDFARGLNLTQIEPQTSLLETIWKGAPRLKIPVWKCNERFFINTLTGGAPAEVTEPGEGLLKKATGQVSYYLNGLEKVWQHQTSHLTIRSNGSKNKIELDTPGFVISQGKYAGGGVKISTSPCGHFQGQLEFLCSRENNILGTITDLLKMQNSTFSPYDKEDLTLYRAAGESFFIESKTPLPMKLDGEPYSASEVLVECSSRSLELCFV